MVPCGQRDDNLSDYFDALSREELDQRCRIINHIVKSIPLGNHHVTLHGVFPFYGIPTLRGREHTHGLYEAQLILVGKTACCTASQWQTLEPGYLTLHAPQMPHAWRSVDGPFQRFTMWFSVSPELPVPYPACWPYQPQCLTELATLLDDIAIRAPGWPDRVVLYTSLLISRLLTLTEWPAEDLPDCSTGSPTLHLLDRFLSNNMHRPLSRQEIADYLGISERTLTRQIHVLTGGTLLDRLELHRITRARMMLEQTDASLQAICEQVGYNNPSYFCRRFRQQMGMTPGKYRALKSSA